MSTLNNSILLEFLSIGGKIRTSGHEIPFYIFFKYGLENFYYNKLGVARLWSPFHRKSRSRIEYFYREERIEEIEGWAIANWNRFSGLVSFIWKLISNRGFCQNYHTRITVMPSPAERLEPLPIQWMLKELFVRPTILRKFIYMNFGPWWLDKYY